MNGNTQFSQDLLEGLWKMRHSKPETRGWLRQHIRYMKRRRVK